MTICLLKRSPLNTNGNSLCDPSRREAAASLLRMKGSKTRKTNGPLILRSALQSASRRIKPGRIPSQLAPPLETKSASIDRTHIVGITKDWLGTPYLHQATTKHQGTDCLGLIRGVYREVYGREPEMPPPYTPDWNERRASDEPLLSAARRHLIPVDDGMYLPGRVLIFRIMVGGPAKHCGIISDGAQPIGATDIPTPPPMHFIHAYAGRSVIESWLSRWWRDRVVGIFDYPGAT